MTIQERLKRSNLIMLVVPVAIAGVQRVRGGREPHSEKKA